MPRKKNAKAAVEELPPEMSGLNASEMEAEAERITEASEKLMAALKMKAKAKRLQDELEAPAPEDPPQALEAPAPLGVSPAGLSKLETVLTELDGEGSFEVYNLAGNQESKLGVFDISDWPSRMELIAKEYGGGDFKIKFKHSTGQYAAQITRTFDRKAYGSPSPQNGNGQGSMVDFMKLMAERESAHQREMMALMERSHAATLEAIKAASAPRAESSGISKALEEAMVKKLVADKDPKSDFLDQAKGILEALSLFRDEAPTREPSSPMQTALNELIKVARPLLEMGVRKLATVQSVGGSAPAALPAPAKAPEPVPPQVPAAERPAPVPPGSETVAPISGTEAPAPEGQVNMVDYAANLLAAVSGGMKPEAVASFVYQQTPEDQLDNLASVVNDPQIIPRLLQIEPRLVPHQTWLDSLYKELREMLKPEEVQPS